MRSAPVVRAVSILALVASAAGAQTPQLLRLTLQQAIELAQKQSHTARQALLSLEAARASDRAANAEYMPQLTLGATTPQFSKNIIPVTQPDGTTEFVALASNTAGFNVGVSQRVPLTGGTLRVEADLSRRSETGQRDRLTWSSTPISVGFSQQIFGQNQWKIDKAERGLRADIAERQYLESMEDLAITTTSRFFEVYSAAASVRNAEINAATNDTLYLLNKGRLEIGKISENELLSSQISLLKAQNELTRARMEQARGLANFRLLLNVPPTTQFALELPTRLPAFAADTIVAMREAAANGTQRLELELSAMQAKRGIKTAKVNNGLGATLNAGFGFDATGDDMNAAFRDLSKSQRFSLGLQVPLMQWGIRGAAIREAEANMDRNASQSFVAREQAAIDARFAALEWTQARRTLDIAAQSDTLGAKTFDVAYARYVVGKISVADLYTAQAQKDQAVQGYASALSGYWLAYYRLRRVTMYDFEKGQPIR
jgi:outer membrane protein TolC